jgi:predicted nucleotidyltransferase
MTKTQAGIMKIFVANITGVYSVKQLSEIMKKPYPLIHRSIKELIKNKFISKDERNLLSLNYKENHQELAFIESIRKKEFLEKNKTLSIFVKDLLNKIKNDFFIMLIFGSAIRNKQPRDIDVIVIAEKQDESNKIDKILHNIASNFSIKFDCNVITIDSAYEMLAKRDRPNVMNETLNNHILIFGAENYYRVLKNAR